MALNFPSSPSYNDIHEENGTKWIWNGSAWVRVVSAGPTGAQGAQGDSYWVSTSVGIHTLSNIGVGTTNPTEKLEVTGNAIISGSITKGSGTFNIPHPIAPEKRLVHSFIEGPRADLIYRGKTTLNNGISTIYMDEIVGLTTGTWQALCRDPQIFLQNNQSFISLKGSITFDGILTILASEYCDDEIDWLVIVERQDQVIKNANWTDEDGKPILEPSI